MDALQKHLKNLEAAVAFLKERSQLKPVEVSGRSKSKKKSISETIRENVNKPTKTVRA